MPPINVDNTIILGSPPYPFNSKFAGRYVSLRYDNPCKVLSNKFLYIILSVLDES